jgi:hypothetical protein
MNIKYFSCLQKVYSAYQVQWLPADFLYFTLHGLLQEIFPKYCLGVRYISCDVVICTVKIFFLSNYKTKET